MLGKIGKDQTKRVIIRLFGDKNKKILKKEVHSN